MDEQTVKNALRLFTQESVGFVGECQGRLDPYRFRGAGNDPGRDATLTGLPSFQAALGALGALSDVREHFGQDRAGHVTLQFVYGMLSALETPVFDQALFEQLWIEFTEELSSSEWTYVGIANLYNFDCAADYLELGNGMYIHRKDAALAERLSWRDAHFEQLHADTGSLFRFATHVLLAEDRIPKSPDTIVQGNTVESAEKIESALLALRLLKEGSVSIGHIFQARPSHFFSMFGARAVSGTGTSNTQPQHPHYALSAADTPEFRSIFDQLERFGRRESGKWKNVEVALRAFSVMYGRVLARPDDKVLDASTALEALLKPDKTGETTFTLAFRGACLLADNDEDREQRFGDIKKYYGARSTVIHGGGGDNVQQYIAPFQNIIRKLLRGFITLALSGTAHDQFYQRIDKTLLHAEKREKLRQDMGLGNI